MFLFSALLSAVAIASSLISPSYTEAPRLLPPTPPAVHGVWPVRSHSVVRGFEPPPDQFAAGHRGVDLAGALGAPVFASLAGTVTFAGLIAGRGVVVISHGETRTTYEPVIAEVAASDLVSAGDRIGVLDVTQSHCFPSACLHWGWIRDQQYLDPLLLVPESHRVRLLPLGTVTPADGPGDTQP